MMKRYALSVLMVMAVCVANGQTVQQKINALLAKMTLEEKVGQMTQVTLAVVLQKGSDLLPGEEQAIDDAKLKEAILKYRVGSILNTSNTAYTREHWFKLISQIQNTAATSRLKIPVLYGIDAIHGMNYTLGSTLFPQEIALAATFNPELARRAGEITAYECRASYIPWNFSPVLDLGKNPVWPRIYETFGEDPLLAAKMGSAMVKGYQGNDIGGKYNVAACMKHFLGYSAPLSGKDRTPAWIPDRYMREYFLPSFTEAVKAGARTVMINSSEINGVPVHASHYLLTDLLRKELHFTGVAVSDWQDIQFLHSRHHVAATDKDAVMMAVNAGIDMSMVPNDFTFYTLLLELAKEGKVSPARINEAVGRILTLKYQTGLFEHPVGNPNDYPKFGSEEFRQVSYNAAAEAITLLKNQDNVLPLKKNIKVLVTGPTADNMRSLNGGWTYTWQGQTINEIATNKNTILKAIRNKIGADHVLYQAGADFEQLIDIPATTAAAQQSDVVILCVGETSYTETPGNIDDLNLSDSQITLARAMFATGKPVVLVLAEGRPRIITPINNGSNAVLTTYLPGNEGANALADILFGDVNPSGRLPYTYPRYANSLLNYYRKNIENNGAGDTEHGYNPLYEFGFGLSYTTFAYSNLRISKASITGNEALTITVDVTNTGTREGKESTQLYISDLYASITPDTKRLRGFSKISLKPGETKTVTFTKTAADLSFIDGDSKRVTEPGEFRVSIGNLTANFTYVDKTYKAQTGGKL
jgi:beta-glucosidase